MMSDITFTLVDGGTPVALPAQNQLGFIDILNGDWDSEPDGYALPPGVPNGFQTIVATVSWQVGPGEPIVPCTNNVHFSPLPPPMTVSQKHPFVEGGTGALGFQQKFPLAVDNTYPIWLYGDNPCIDFGLGFGEWCYGSSAENPQDYTGMSPSYGAWNGLRIEFPAHTQTEVISLQFPDDRCFANPHMKMGWMYEQDILGFPPSPINFSGFLGNPTAQFTIFDNGDLPCAISHETIAFD